MASRAKYVKATISSDARSLSGYRVIGDFADDGVRYVMLERPESAAPTRKPRARKTTGASTGSTSTVFPVTGVANG